MRERPLQLPPDIAHPAVRKAADAYTALVERERVERQNGVELEHAIARAEQADHQAHADAIRADRKPPAPKASKARATFAVKLAEVNALALAVADARAELIATAEEHRDELAAEHQAAHDEAAGRARTALDVLEAALGDFSEAVARAGWLERFPEGKYAAGGGIAFVPGLLDVGHNQYQVGAVLAALRVRVDPPATPAPSPPNAQPLMPFGSAGG